MTMSLWHKTFATLKESSQSFVAVNLNRVKRQSSLPWRNRVQVCLAGCLWTWTAKEARWLGVWSQSAANDPESHAGQRFLSVDSSVSSINMIFLLSVCVEFSQWIKPPGVVVRNWCFVIHLLCYFVVVVVNAADSSTAATTTTTTGVWNLSIHSHKQSSCDFNPQVDPLFFRNDWCAKRNCKQIEILF